MVRIQRLMLVLAMLCIGNHASTAWAESQLEPHFQDMFVTAGYSAAAGAAIGAAALSFKDNPGKNLRFISIGASIGFVGGMLFGGWIALAPMLAVDSQPSFAPQIAGTTNQLIIRPWVETSRFRLTGLEAGAVLAKF